MTFSEGGNDSVTLTATPNDDSFGEYATPSTSTVTVLKPEVKGIFVTPETSVIGTGTVQLKAYEYYSYGQAPVDVTESVTWTVEPLSAGGETYGITVVGSGEGAGLVTSSTLGGSVYIQAKSTESFEARSTLNVLGMCGSGVDDIDPTSALGFCLKVAETSLGLFSSTPNLDIGENLGLKDGVDYSSVRNSKDGPFLSFSVSDEKYEHWCERLNLLHFAGITSWRTADKMELDSLFGELNNMSDNYGWLGRVDVNGGENDELGYISNEQRSGPDSLYRVDLNHPADTTASSNGYASCIAK
ncbi:hypothetical protein BTO01_22485 [Vibrio jasicida]|nr:hypothetical protein BTO01_22485 [Vibrio jasicida]